MSRPASIPRPYPGIRPFEEADSSIFFGREAQVNDLITKLETSRFVAVVGSSGSGKSSMVKAGLLPTLKLGLLRDVDDWHSLVIRAGSHPFRTLAEQILRRHLGLSEDAEISREQALRVEGLAVELRKCPGGLADILRQFDWPHHVHFALVVDQFEEIFGFRTSAQPAVSRDDVERLVQLLLKTAAAPIPAPPSSESPPAAAAELSTRVWTVLTMRSDFIGQCEVFPALAEAVSNSQFLVPVLNEQQKEDAIRRPGQHVPGATYRPFEIEPALVRMIVNDSGDQMDQLPLMQHSLMRTWAEATLRWAGEEEARRLRAMEGEINARLRGTAAGEGQGTRLILPTDYVPLSQALNQHAEAAWEKILTQKPPQPAQEALTRPLFLSLCDWSPDGAVIRRRPTVESVLALTGASLADVEAVIRTFQEDERNFILPILPPVVPGNPAPSLSPTDVLDISHEALLRQWKTYRRWQEENRKDITELRDLCRRSQLFQENPIRVLSKEDLSNFKKWKLTKTDAWAQRYVLKEDWPALQGIEKLFAASDLSLKQADRYKRAYAKVAAAFIFFGALIALAGLIEAGRRTKKANEAEEVATRRTTVSLSRSIGSSAGNGSISDEESDTLWDIARLAKTDEPVRTALLDDWFSSAARFNRGANPAGDGIGTAMGLSLGVHFHATGKANLLMDKIVNQGTSDFSTYGDSENNWRLLGQFFDSSALHARLEALIEKFEQGKALDTSVGDACMIIKLLAARSAVASDWRKGSPAGAATQLIKAANSTNSNYNIAPFEDALQALASKMDATDATTVAEQLIKALESSQVSDAPLEEYREDHSCEFAKVLASLLAKLDDKTAAPLAKRGVAHLLRALDTLFNAYNPEGFDAALTGLMPKVDAAAAAAMAESLVKKLEDPQTEAAKRPGLALALAILMSRLDSSAASLAQRGVDQLLTTLSQRPQNDSSGGADSLAEMLAGPVSRLDLAAAPVVQRVAHSVVGILAKSEFISRFDLIWPALPGLMTKLDAASVFPVAKRLIEMLNSTQHVFPGRRAKMAALLKILALKLNGSEVTTLTNQLVENSLPIDDDEVAALSYLLQSLDVAAAAALAKKLVDNPGPLDERHATALSCLLDKLDGATAAVLAKRGADKVLQKMQAAEPGDFEGRADLVQALQALLTKLEAGAAEPLALQGADQWVKTLESEQIRWGYDFSPLLAQPLTRLTARLKAADITAFAEQSLQALEHTSIHAPFLIHRCSRTVAGLAENLDPSGRRIIRHRLLSLLVGKLLKAVNEDKTESGGNDKKWESSARQLAEYFCQSAFVLPPKEKEMLLSCILWFILADASPASEDQTRENNIRRVTIEALATLDVPALAGILKWPQCRGEAQQLVLTALEQKTHGEFHGDIWQFVAFAAKTCYPGVDLDGPAGRISLKDMLQAVSKPLNLTAAKSGQP